MLVAEQRSQPLLVLAKTGMMAARSSLPLSAVQGLVTGQPATVLIEDHHYAATVTALGMRAQTGYEDERYLVEVEFEIDPDHDYRAGQAATIRLP
jgi:hypothetical protein